jgi:hypothetical protein
VVFGYFYLAWWIRVFAGVFEKKSANDVVFCGEFVVDCMVKLVR